jgi:hypothetical protein
MFKKLNAGFETAVQKRCANPKDFQLLDGFEKKLRIAEKAGQKLHSIQELSTEAKKIAPQLSEGAKKFEQGAQKAETARIAGMFGPIISGSVAFAAGVFACFGSVSRSGLTATDGFLSTAINTAPAVVAVFSTITALGVAAYFYFSKKTGILARLAGAFDDVVKFAKEGKTREDLHDLRLRIDGAMRKREEACECIDLKKEAVTAKKTYEENYERAREVISAVNAGRIGGYLAKVAAPIIAGHAIWDAVAERTVDLRFAFKITLAVGLVVIAKRLADKLEKIAGSSNHPEITKAWQGFKARAGNGIKGMFPDWKLFKDLTAIGKCELEKHNTLEDKTQELMDGAGISEDEM